MRVTIMNFNNACKRIESEQLEQMWRDIKGQIMWCGDFNSREEK